MWEIMDLYLSQSRDKEAAQTDGVFCQQELKLVPP